MAAYIKSMTFDCTDALVVAAFWAAALGSDVDEDSTSAKAFVEPAGWGGPSLWFADRPGAQDRQEPAAHRPPGARPRSPTRSSAWSG